MLIIVVIVIIILLSFILKFIEKNKKNSEISNIYEENYNKYYRPKRYVTTLNELNFYNVLLEIAKELNMILFAQVSLYNYYQ